MARKSRSSTRELGGQPAVHRQHDLPISPPGQNRGGTMAQVYAAKRRAGDACDASEDRLLNLPDLVEDDPGRLGVGEHYR